MRRHHQNIVIDDKDLPAEYSSRRNSNFFNEGKWWNFIAPLLPTDRQDMAFIDIGCNVGLFLRLAQESGFRSVIGVEANADDWRMAHEYRDAYAHDYKILHRSVGADFSFDELPVADVVLLSNVHYYIPMSEFLPFLDRLFYKTVYCIIVSREMRDKKHGHPLPDIDSIRHMFRDWELVRVIRSTRAMLDSDPHPRKVHSMLFRSRLRRRPICDHTNMSHDYPKQQEFIDVVESGKSLAVEDSLNWQFWAERKKDQWDDEQIREHVQRRFDVVRDIMEHGMKEPILVHPDWVGIDGGNRAAILRLLGYDSIIVRIV